MCQCIVIMYILYTISFVILNLLIKIKILICFVITLNRLIFIIFSLSLSHLLIYFCFHQNCIRFGYI